MGPGPDGTSTGPMHSRKHRNVRPPMGLGARPGHLFVIGQPLKDQAVVELPGAYSGIVRSAIPERVPI